MAVGCAGHGLASLERNLSAQSGQPGCDSARQAAVRKFHPPLIACVLPGRSVVLVEEVAAAAAAPGQRRDQISLGA